MRRPHPHKPHARKMHARKPHTREPHSRKLCPRQGMRRSAALGGTAVALAALAAPVVLGTEAAVPIGPITAPAMLTVPVMLVGFVAAAILLAATGARGGPLFSLAVEPAENEDFRTLADTAPVLIWLSGPDGGLTYVNRYWLDFTGRTLDDEIGNGWIEGVHPEDSGRCRAVHEHAFERRAPFRVEVRLRRADGTYRWLLTTGTPRIAPDNRYLGFIGSSVDISDHREVQAELARHRAHLESLIRDRTSELEAKSRQLQQADRLASIGTLTAGLGHDMNNVLFAVRCRLDALRWEEVPQNLMDLLQSVAHAVTYLQQLTDGLRLFSLDPEDAAASASLTDGAGDVPYRHRRGAVPQPDDGRQSPQVDHEEARDQRPHGARPLRDRGGAGRDLNGLRVGLLGRTFGSDCRNMYE